MQFFTKGPPDLLGENSDSRSEARKVQGELRTSNCTRKYALKIVGKYQNNIKKKKPPRRSAH